MSEETSDRVAKMAGSILANSKGTPHHFAVVAIESHALAAYMQLLSQLGLGDHKVTFLAEIHELTSVVASALTQANDKV